MVGIFIYFVLVTAAPPPPTGTDVKPRPRPTSSASLPRPPDARPSLPPRRPVGRAASAAAAHGPPLPPRLYGEPETADNGPDLIQLEAPEPPPPPPERPAAGALGPERLAQLYGGGAAGPPLPPRVPAHPLHSSIPSALPAVPPLLNGACGPASAGRPLSLALPSVPTASPATTPGSATTDPSFESLRVLLRKPPCSNGNLIDLGEPAPDHSAVRRSVLEVFDPLSAPPEPPPAGATGGAEDAELSDQVRELLAIKACTTADEDAATSYYEQSDPFQYMYGRTGPAESLYEPLATRAPTDESDGEPPPLPPRQQRAGPMTPERPPGRPVELPASRIQAYKQRQRSSDSLISSSTGIKVRKTRGLSCDSDIVAFCDMIKELRGSYPADDRATNPGLITSATIETSQQLDATVKLMIHHQSRTSPVCFTCDNPSDYVLRVCGAAEYLTAESALHDYQYVQRCIKYEEDVRLSLIHTEQLTLPLQRTVSDRADLRLKLSTQLGPVQDAVRLLLIMYCQAFRTDFSVVQTSTDIVERPLTEVLDTVLIRVSALHRLRHDNRYEQYVVTAQLYHGSRAVSQTVATAPVAPTKHLFKWCSFNAWLEFTDVALCCLPREARLVVTVSGLMPEQPADAKDPVRLHQEEVGWAALQMFDFEGILAEGGYVLPLWPPEAMKELGPAPFPGTHPSADKCTAITVDLPSMCSRARVRFPPVESNPTSSRKEFSSLDVDTQTLLLDTLETDLFTQVPADRREILWDRRHYLYDEPAALPRVLLAAHSWEWACLPDLHSMVQSWGDLAPVDAIQLLLPSFPDVVVRRKAVRWLQSITSDELVDYLPQLVQAVKHEAWDCSTLARFLIDRALTSPRVAHHLYWLLHQCLPADGGEPSVTEARYLRRLTVLQRALRSTCGRNLLGRFLSQEVLLRGLYEAAEHVKTTKESMRLRELMRCLDQLRESLERTPTSLPLDPALEVCGIDVPACSYFPSNTLPLRVQFCSAEDNGETLPVIYKVGDDLRQDMLTIQMIRIMDKLWLKEGLDLRMVTFNCVPTGHCRGMIEMVQSAETLRKIQGEHGVTGAFKDMTIAEWLAKHNPTELEYERAAQNFTASCAGYCVATYVLGICDRHNDNIMLRSSGHLFHIDFGKFLGDAQRFGAFKRDRAPFVLTSDMAYVINGGDKPSARFQLFVDLCCKGFNILRRHGNIFLNLFALMTSSGIPGVSRDAIDYIQRALLPNMVEHEAAAFFARMIQESLKSWFTSVNFFLHSLAQLRFTGDHNDEQLLSFVPKRYTEATDGRISSVTVYGYQKRYEPEKCYVFILRVQRENMTDPVYVFRTYKEFIEFGQKLTMAFPLVMDFYSLPKGGRLGRSHIRQVAEARRRSISNFLRKLWQLAEREPKPTVNRTAPHYIRGQLQLSFCYQRNTFSVFVHHAKDLELPDGQEPNAYVKIYLQPDPNKVTKRKTKVVRKNNHPSFMEMIGYRMPLADVEDKTLQASLWHQDHLQENVFLGAVVVRLADFDLTQETQQWYNLTNFSR
ncbi:Phosphatidylinositol 4-phosphate 3-kinase C2 domain-containing subunit alpha [Amphibalanus amphitrite]|uniref:Phosphatidylinositol 4-phosphate 3-kinase C2 domain-containing subunit alpha n=1 Tax=Amphibalanus amphitrite TaxID=1232801 RepID=A0A6A4W8B8_AMPAM|nr:Phosphatidylinositol 4-phosphate 3-kinase C2 domain-containing subunit alpha [Amphibalanus amphitrite]